MCWSLSSKFWSRFAQLFVFVSNLDIKSRFINPNINVWWLLVFQQNSWCLVSQYVRVSQKFTSSLISKVFINIIWYKLICPVFNLQIWSLKVLSKNYRTRKPAQGFVWTTWFWIESCSKPLDDWKNGVKILGYVPIMSFFFQKTELKIIDTYFTLWAL